MATEAGRKGWGRGSMIPAPGWFWTAPLFMGSGRVVIEVVISRQECSGPLGFVIRLIVRKERLKFQSPSWESGEAEPSLTPGRKLARTGVWDGQPCQCPQSPAYCPSSFCLNTSCFEDAGLLPGSLS